MVTSEKHTLHAQDMALDDPVPSYEESVDSKARLNLAASPEKHQTGSNDLARRLAEVQCNRVEATIDQHIMPSLQAHIESGLFQATFALILSDLAHYWQVTEDALNGDEYPGFVRGVRLQGDGNSQRFWSQPQVLQQLKQSLRVKLGLRNPMLPSGETKSVGQILPARPVQEKPRKSWFSRRDQTFPSEKPRSQMFSQASAGWREPDKTSLPDLQVSVEELRVRVTTSMGLYQTTACAAVVIKINVGV